MNVSPFALLTLPQVNIHKYILKKGNKGPECSAVRTPYLKRFHYCWSRSPRPIRVSGGYGWEDIFCPVNGCHTNGGQIQLYREDVQFINDSMFCLFQHSWGYSWWKDVFCKSTYEVLLFRPLDQLYPRICCQRPEVCFLKIVEVRFLAKLTELFNLW